MKIQILDSRRLCFLAFSVSPLFLQGACSKGGASGEQTSNFEAGSGDAGDGDDGGTGSDGGNGQVSDDPDGSAGDAGPPKYSSAPVVLNSRLACRVDLDCASDLHCFQGNCIWECSDDEECGDGICSERRRCVSGEEGEGYLTALTPEVIPGVQLADPSPRVLRVSPGQSHVSLWLPTSGPVPKGSIAYTIESFERSTDESTYPSKLQKCEGETECEVVLPTGAADPNSENSGIVEVMVSTNVGTITVQLEPSAAPEAVYAGTVQIPRFGQVGLPLDFEIVTEPRGATLDEAEAVYLLLPTRPDSIFSPISPIAQADGESLSVPLVEQNGEWIGTARAPFDLSQGALLSGYGADEVVRSLRFALEFDGRSVSGTVRDTWEGLFDERTVDGVVSRGSVVFEGELHAERVAALAEGLVLPPAAELSVVEIPAKPLPDVAASCEATDFAVSPLSVNNVLVDCDGISNVTEFEAASADVQEACAIAVAETALLGNTTASLIQAFLSGDTETTGNESFSDFMTRCTEGVDGACRPSHAVQCGRALTAYAMAVQQTPSALMGASFDAYAKTTRESFLGRQLGAYQRDADARLEWLQSQQFPAVVTSQVRELNAGLIEDWKDTVLDAHFGALAGQYDELGLSVLARQLEGTNLVDDRQLLLTEMSQSWRSAMEGLTLVARRSGDVYQESDARQAETEYVSARALELYVLGGLVDELNQAAGAGFASAGLATGFSALSAELSSLSLPLSALIFKRDAEVVVSQSLDPLSDDNTVLTDIQSRAMTELDTTSELVGKILERAQEQKVDEQLLRDDLKNQIADLFDELINLCGLPEGCANSDREKPECWPRILAGECGFGTEIENLGTADAPELTVKVVDYTSSINVSDAGQAILDVVAATEARASSQATILEYKKATQQMWNTFDHFACRLTGTTDPDLSGADPKCNGIESWQDRIDAQETVIQQKLDIIRLEGDASIAALDTWHAETQRLRQEDRDARGNEVEVVLATMSTNAANGLRRSQAISGMSGTSATLKGAADQIDTVAAILADGMPKGLDDLGAVGRTVVGMTAYGVTSIMKGTALALDIAAEVATVNHEYKNQVEEIAVNRAELTSELRVKEREDAITALEDELDKKLGKNSVEEQRARDFLDILYAGLALDREMDEAFFKLGQRRDEILNRAVELAERHGEAHQAQLTIQQKQSSYLRIVRRAQLLDGRLRNMIQQRDALNLNLGSPGIVFGWASQLEQAESRLERAKDKMMDWVVALEYLAVRPFMDARLQILLARNTHQLQEIAASLQDIQDRCGGAINTHTSTISLRDDVLLVDSGQSDEAGDQVLSREEVFRQILGRASIPVDKRLRFSADQTIGDIARRSDVWGASFDISLHKFANLAASCNAKVQEISIQLVGEGLGDAQPTVALAYDGTSSIRSCQPDIEDLVDVIGRGATAFGATTVFHTAGRVLAPVAGVNEWASTNQSLAGLPLASQYSLIIDPELGENSRIHWDALEDVLIRVTYGYQDFFPAGQCK